MSRQGLPPTAAHSAAGQGATPLVIRPQPGPQEAFLSSGADFVLYGGAAGGGKSFAMLLDPLRYVASHPGSSRFGAVIFRRTRPEITNEGGLWDESQPLYTALGAAANQQRLSWRFPSGAKIQFAQMQHEKDRFRWQGSQIAYLGFDELTHFTWKQFNYMLSRVRSASGIKPCIRATCNPDPDHWLARFIEWYIDRESGYAVPERSGQIRWFVLDGDDVVWGDDPRKLEKKHKRPPISFTFIPALVTDNKILLERNPEYLANLEALDVVQRERLKNGNWKINYTAGALFQRGWFEIVDVAPADALRVRFWDRAATPVSSGSPDPDWTRGVKFARDRNGLIYVEHVASLRATPHQVRNLIKNIASQDGRACAIGLAQDPGAAGVSEASDLARELAGYAVHLIKETLDKITRALPLSRQAEMGNIKLVRGDWNDEFLSELQNFPAGKHDDQVDAASGCLFMFMDNMVAAAPDKDSYQSLGKRAGAEAKRYF